MSGHVTSGRLRPLPFDLAEILVFESLDGGGILDVAGAVSLQLEEVGSLMSLVAVDVVCLDWVFERQCPWAWRC